MLPGLNPTLTRASYFHSSSPENNASRLQIEKLAPTPDDFIVSAETGLWLAPVAVASGDVQADIAKLAWLHDRPLRDRRIIARKESLKSLGAILHRSEITEIGCIEAGLRGGQTPATTVLQLAGIEKGTYALTEPEELPYLCTCGNSACYNTRHYVIEYGSKAFRQRVELNPSWYIQRPDDTIQTIWGDILPSVEDSLKAFVSFQRKNYPFIPYDKTLLTPTPLSQIMFHPLTGCWESYEYGTLQSSKGAYGIMYGREVAMQVDQETGEVIQKGFRRGSVMAHNLVWERSGNIVDTTKERNHRCMYTRCCNPLHLEEITPEENKQHGAQARAKIRAAKKSDPEQYTFALTKKERYLLQQTIRMAYLAIVAEH